MENKEIKHMNTAVVAGTAMLVAVAFILQYIEMSIPIMPAFIKLDFSDLPEVIAAYAYGPVYGVLVCFLKNLIHLPFTSSAGIGELSNFVLGAIFVIPAGLIYKRKKSKKNAIVGGVIGAIFMGVASIVTNYFVIYPLYYTVLGFPEVAILGMYKVIAPFVENILQCLIVFNLPFTVIKGLISVGITMFIYKPLSPLLKGQSRR